MSKKLHFFNMYLTSTISVALVLFLVGILCSLMLASRNLVNQVRESVTLYVELNTSADTTNFARMLSASPYCHDYQFVSKEQALEQYIQEVGEDPTEFLGFNPLCDAYEVHTTSLYSEKDSIEHIRKQLLELPYIERVNYQSQVLDVINSQLIRKVFWVLLATMAILLTIAITLIINTIRLQIYSQRFLINTMTLVGATAWKIRAPFIRRNITLGLLAALLALIALAGGLYYIIFKMGIEIFPLTRDNILILVGVVILAGIIISTLSAIISTGRYIRMNRDTMYRI